MQSITLNGLVLIWMVLIWTPCAFGQIREQVASGRVAKAYDLANELIAAREQLPARWAAKQTRQIVNTHELDSFRIYQSNVTELMAFRRDKDSTEETLLTHFTTGSQRMDGGLTREGLGMQVRSYQAANLKLHKIQNEPWEDVDKIPNIGYPSTDPFSWCLGLLNSARSGSMDEDYLTAIFYHQGRSECLEAWFNKKGELVAFWGSTKKPKPGNPAYAIETRFDVKRKVIVHYGLIQFKERVTVEDINARRYEVVEFGKVAWEPFPNPDPDAKMLQLLLPVSVNVYSVMNEGEEIESTNSIQWLVGDEVPDSVFVDPRTPEFAVPEFEPLAESSDKR